MLDGKLSTQFVRIVSACILVDDVSMFSVRWEKKEKKNLMSKYTSVQKEEEWVEAT